MPCSVKTLNLQNHVFYRDILDSIWEILTVKTAKVNFERQLEKLEELFPSAEEFDMYAVYPAMDACEGLSTLLHGLLDREHLFENMIKLSQQSVKTVCGFGRGTRC